MSSYHCSNCSAPIKLDETLKNLSKAQSDLIIKKATQASKVPLADPSTYIPRDRLHLLQQALEESSLDALHHQNDSNLIRARSNSKSSYVYVPNHEEEAKEENGREEINGTSSDRDHLPDFSRIKALDHVFEILSQNQDVSHPMSAECAQLLIENYKFKFDQSQREKEYYLSFLKKLRDREANYTAVAEAETDSKLADAAHELEELKLLEQSKLEELEELEKTHEDLQAQLKDLDEELEKLHSEDLNDVLRLKNSLAMDLSRKQNHLHMSKALYQKQLDHLDTLRTLNIFTRLFQIHFDQDDSCGKINGFRLGYRVPWPEVNAALGQVVHLLKFMAQRLELEIAGYKLVALGSKSYILKISGRTTDEDGRTKNSSILQLHSTNEFTLGKLFNFNKLDVSLIALLDVVSQVEAKIVQLDEEFELPYAISPNHDKIGGKSIRATSNSRWTEACGFLLTDLSWMLTFVAARSDTSG